MVPRSRMPPEVDNRATVEGTIDSLAGIARPYVSPREVFALVLAWSREEPGRIGEVALVPSARVLGRGGARADDPSPRVELMRPRPGASPTAPPIGSLRISRLQLVVRPTGDGLEVESVGRCPMFVNGTEVRTAVVRPGDTVLLQNELLLLVARRPEVLAAHRNYPPDKMFPFGEADPFGVVGESVAAWRLREDAAFAAGTQEHVLVHGASGVGKELVAGAIHGLSARARRPMVARNAATLPEGLIDAELFGNVKNYPNPGTAEREGLVGEADGSTLFLDEIGEMPPYLQAHLLRVLDRNGEYQRLGDARARRADLRIVAATNRRLDELKHDFAARLTVRIAVPSLADRRDDIPLLVRHFLRRAAARQPALARAFCAEAPGGGVEPRTAPALIDALVRHEYRLHSRELEQLLWAALSESRGAAVQLTPGVERLLAAPPAAAPAERAEPATEAPEATREQIVASLARCDGNVTRAARELGLKNRFVLYRLMRKQGLAGGPSGAGDDEPEAPE